MFDVNDIEVDIDGDLVVDTNGDIKIADSRQTTFQDVLFRIRTQTGDFQPHPTLGSNVISMQGEPNTAQVGSIISEMVTRSLIYDSRFSSSDFTVKVFPTSADTIFITVLFEFVFGDTSTSSLVVSANFNYTTGTIEAIAGPNQSGSGSL